MPVRVDERVAGVFEIVFSFPPVNALGAPAFEELVAVLEATGRDESARAVVLRSGIEKGFSAGLDVREVDAGLAGRHRIAAACSAAFAAVLECPVPVVAAVHGFCLAAGVGLVSNADVIVASDDATFGFPEIDRGEQPGVAVFDGLVPTHKARWLALSGERISADELARLGSIERVVPRSRLELEARGLAETIARKDPGAVRRIKRSFVAPGSAGTAGVSPGWPAPGELVQRYA